MRNLVLCLLTAMLIVAISVTGEAIRDDALVLYCSFSEGAGDKVNDESGNELQGEIKGGAKWAKAGKVGGAIAFSAAAQSVEFPVEEILNITKGVTMEGWINPDSVQGDSDLWGRRTSANQGGYCMQWTNGMIETWIHKGGWQGTRDKQTVKPKPGEWHHVAGVYDGKKVRQYVDGELDIEFDLSGDMDSVEEVFRIGQAQTGLETMMGVIDEVAVYSRALAEDEIKEDMEKGILAAVNSTGKLATTWASIKW